VKKKIIWAFISCLFVLLVIGQMESQPVVAKTKFAAEWEAVVSSRQKAIDQSDSVAKEKYELAVAYANLGAIKKANDLFDQLEELDWKEKVKQLIAEYSATLAKEDKDIKVINYLAFAYYLDDQYKKAENLFNRIIRLDPKNIWSYNYLAVVQHERGNYEQAETTLEESLLIMENQYTHFLLGFNYYKKSNLFKAAYHFGKGRKAAKMFLGD